MKSQWPIILFVVGVIAIVLFAFNYEAGDMVSLSEIFPDEEQTVSEDITYEFVDEKADMANVEEDIESRVDKIVATQATTAAVTASSEPEVVQKASIQKPKKEPVVEKKKEIETLKIEHITAETDFNKVPFTIQTASYKDKARADKALKEMQEAGYPAYIFSADLGAKGTWHRIYVGKFQTKEQAIDYLSKLKSSYKSSFIIKP